MNRRILSLTAALLCMCVFSSCALKDGKAGEAQKETQQLQKKVVEDCGLPARFDASFNPITTANKYNYELSPLIFDPVIALDDSFLPTPAIADSFNMEEGNTVCRLVLKSGVLFHDGSPVTAGDVQASVELAKNDPASIYRTRFGEVAGFEIISDQVLLIRLSSPNALFASKLSVPVVKGGSAGKYPVGSGRYMLSQGEQFTLSANESWKLGASPSIKNIKLADIKDNDSLVSALDKDDVDFIYLSAAESGRIALTGDYTYNNVVTNELCFLGISGGSKLNTPVLRRAVGVLVDRGELLDEVIHGGGFVTISPINPVWGRFKSPPASDDAANLFAQEGYYKNDDGVYAKKGQPLALRVGVNLKSFTLCETGTALVEMLKKEGIKAELIQIQDPDFRGACAGGSIDVYLEMTRLLPDMDVSSVAASYGNLNYGRCGSAQVDEAISNLKKAQGEEIGTAAEALISALYSEQNVIPLYFNTAAVISKRSLDAKLKPRPADAYFGLENAFSENNEKGE